MEGSIRIKLYLLFAGEICRGKVGPQGSNECVLFNHEFCPFTGRGMLEGTLRTKNRQKGRVDHSSW
jgi:hypothetical protein